MAKTTNSLRIAGPIVVEHSDERLAAVEEAKRTGGELQSVGHKGDDIVDRDIVREAVEKVSNEGSSDPSQPLPDYLVELQRGAAPTAELNKMKAEEHNEYSRQIVEAQMEAEVENEAKLRKDPYYFAHRIAENNRRLADEHNKKSAEFARGLYEINEGVSQEIRPISPEEAMSDEPLTALGLKAKVTDISESFAREQLEQKDRIIYGEDSYKQQALAPRKVAPTDKRGLDTSMTDEPMRLEEPVVEQEPGSPADSPVIDASSAGAEADGGSDNDQKPDTARVNPTDDGEDKPKRRSPKSGSKD